MGTLSTISKLPRPTFLISDLQCASVHAPDDACGYQVAWSINPHMRVGSVDLSRASAQQALMRHVLGELGARLIDVPFVHGAFDSVFAKDNALLTRTRGTLRALLGTPLHAERQREQLSRARTLEQLGFEVVRSTALPLEGGDVVMLPHGHGALLGHGFRSSRRVARTLESFLGAEVLPLELVDPHLYHLDTALAVLADGTALVCEEAFRPTSLAVLRDHPAIHRWLRVPRGEALRFGCNLVEVGNAVVINRAARWTHAALELLGHQPVGIELDQFHRAGGSAACLVAQVHDLDQVSILVGESPGRLSAAPT
jgi:N-dimethylarginine dimethylaminohydrolase